MVDVVIWYNVVIRKLLSRLKTGTPLAVAWLISFYRSLTDQQNRFVVLPIKTFTLDPAKT